MKFIPVQSPVQHPCFQEPVVVAALFAVDSHTGLSLPPVHPHSGNPAHFLPKRPGLCGITAYCVAAWEAGILH